MTTPLVRWGILGAGHIAQRFAGDMAHSETGRLVAVASRSLAKAQDLAGQSGGARAFGDYADLAGWDQVDAVYVATPNALHRAHCLLAIDAGKAVLCEKPFAQTASEAREIAEAAEAAGVFCMEAMWTRFLPTVAALRDRIKSGALGQVAHLEVTLGFPRHEAPGDPITDPAYGGGALPDLGVYGVSIAQDLLGPGRLVGSEIVWSEAGASRTACLLLRHERGDHTALSSISVSHASQLSNRLVVSGADARATLEAPFIEARWGYMAGVHWAAPGAWPSGLKARLLRSPIAPFARRLRGMIRSAEGRSFGTGFPGSGLQFEIDAVGRCLAAGETASTRMPLQATIAVLEVLEAARGVQE